MNPATRGTLSDFLKSRRARLRPEDVGLPTSRHRRLRGLRREEVAALAGVGDTWYGLFESGKPIHISRHLIESVGSALRLNADEMQYLHSLVVTDSEREIDFEGDIVDPLVMQTLATIEAVPAFVIGPRLDYLALNALARRVYRLAEHPEPNLANLALRLFLSAEARELYPEWADSAARAVSKLRRNFGKYLGNESFARLVAQLTNASPEFQKLWELHEIAPVHERISDALGLPGGARFHYRLQAFNVADSRDQSLVVMLPLTSSDASILHDVRARESGPLV